MIKKDPMDVVHNPQQLKRNKLSDVVYLLQQYVDDDGMIDTEDLNKALFPNGILNELSEDEISAYLEKEHGCKVYDCCMEEDYVPAEEYSDLEKAKNDIAWELAEANKRIEELEQELEDAKELMKGLV